MLFVFNKAHFINVTFGRMLETFRADIIHPFLFFEGLHDPIKGDLAPNALAKKDLIIFNLISHWGECFKA